MESYILLGILLGLPVALGVIFRISAPNLFFSIMAGELLARYFGEEAELINSSLTKSADAAMYSHLIVLLMPVVLTCLFLRNSVSRSKTILNIIPLAVTGVVFAAFALPILPYTLQNAIKSTELGNQFASMDSLVVGVVVIFQLIALWLMNLTGSHGKGHKK